MNSRGVVSDDLREQTIKLFGTDDLNEIFPEVPQSAEISTTVPAFDAVLLACGINPHDIEGEMVQPPAPLQQAFQKLRDGLENETPYGEFKDFTVDPSSAMDPVHDSSGSGGYPNLADQKDESGAKKGKKDKAVAPPDSPKNIQQIDSPLDQLFPDFSKAPTNVWDALCQKMVGELHTADTITPEEVERRLRPISIPIMHPKKGKLNLVEDPTGCVAVMSTGAVLWPAAAAMIDWLGKELLSESDAPRCALELGAGLGSVGLFLQMFLGLDVVLSDVAEATELLKKNVNANFKGGVDGPSVEECRWNDDTNMKQVRSHAPGGFDVIVGSDITYREDLLDPLLFTMKKLLKPGGRVFLTMQDRTNEARNFQHGCIRNGWRVISKTSVTPPAIKELTKSTALSDGQEKWGLVPPHIELIWRYEIAPRDMNGKAEIDPILSRTKADHDQKVEEHKGNALDSSNERQAQVVKGFMDRSMGELLCEQDERLRKFIASMSYPPQTDEDRRKLAEAFFDEDGYERPTPPALKFDDEASLLRLRCEAQLKTSKEGLLGIPEIQDDAASKESRKSPKSGKSPKGADTAQAALTDQAATEIEKAEARLCADGVEWDITMVASELKVSVTFTYEAWVKLQGSDTDSAFRDVIDFEIAEDALRVKHKENLVLDLRLTSRVDSDRATAKLSSKNRRVVVLAPMREK